MEDDLKFLFRNKDIPELYRQPQEVLKRPRNFRAILQSYQDYDGQEQWSLHHKKVESAKYASTLCKKDMRKGVICYLVEGASTVLFNHDKAVIQNFYFCPMACIFNSPSWANIKRPTCFAVEDVERSYAQAVTKKFGLVLTDYSMKLFVPFWLTYGTQWHSRVNQASKMERFAKLVNGFKPLTIFEKLSILHAWLTLVLSCYSTGT